MLRAPIWSTSANSTTASTSRGSISSVTIGRPVSSRASARISSASSPSPWKAYGEVRGLKAPPRSIVPPRRRRRAPSRASARGLDRAGPGDEAEVPPPIRARAPRSRSGRARARGTPACTASGWQHLLDARRSPRAAAPASSSRSPIAPITVASRPGVTRAAQPASSRRATTSSTCSAVACPLITISSSGAPVTAMAPSVDARSRSPRYFRTRDDRRGQARASSPASSRPAKTSATTAAASASTSQTQEQGDALLLHRRPALDHRRLRPGGAARARRSTSRRCCSRPGSTPTARPSSARAT